MRPDHSVVRPLFCVASRATSSVKGPTSSHRRLRRSSPRAVAAHRLERTLELGGRHRLVRIREILRTPAGRSRRRSHGMPRGRPSRGQPARECRSRAWCHSGRPALPGPATGPLGRAAGCAAGFMAIAPSTAMATSTSAETAIRPRVFLRMPLPCLELKSCRRLGAGSRPLDRGCYLQGMPGDVKRDSP